MGGDAKRPRDPGGAGGRPRPRPAGPRHDRLRAAQPPGPHHDPLPAHCHSNRVAHLHRRRPPPAHLREALPIDDRGLSGPLGEFFAPIAAAWRFTAAQRARLAPVVETALNTGWTPTELAAFTGGSTGGLPDPAAVAPRPPSHAQLPAPTVPLV